MASVKEIIESMKLNPQNIRFNDLNKVCVYYFGEPRQMGTSHRVFKTPWYGDPRINIQNDHGKSKLYQVKQVLKALERLEGKDVAEE
jgi:hypothetical protein